MIVPGDQDPESRRIVEGSVWKRPWSPFFSPLVQGFLSWLVHGFPEKARCLLIPFSGERSQSFHYFLGGVEDTSPKGEKPLSGRLCERSTGTLINSDWTISFKLLSDGKCTISWACSMELGKQFFLTLRSNLSLCNSPPIHFIGFVSAPGSNWKEVRPPLPCCRLWIKEVCMPPSRWLSLKKEPVQTPVIYLRLPGTSPCCLFCPVFRVPCKVMASRTEGSIPWVFWPAQVRIPPPPHCSGQYISINAYSIHLRDGHFILLILEKDLPAHSSTCW